MSGYRDDICTKNASGKLPLTLINDLSSLLQIFHDFTIPIYFLNLHLRFRNHKH